MTAPPKSDLVAVTGASGFIALHCIRQLLEHGFAVRGTLRDLSKERQVREWLAPLPDGAELSFVEADLTHDEGWPDVVSGVRYLMHVASPVPKAPPKDEEDIIEPAREGTLRALRAATVAGVRRVVLTSSAAAVMSGYDWTDERVFDEDDWSDLSGGMGAYERSKTLAERAAWDFVAQLAPEEAFELVCLNPVYVLGPSLSGIENASNEIVGKLLRRDMPGVPRLHFGLVDVRDVAAAHVSALTSEQAAGERFLLSAEPMWMKEIASTLDEAGYRVPMTQLGFPFLRRLHAADG